MGTQPAELTEAIRLYKEGRRSESRQALVALLTQQPAYLRALVGLARTSDDAEEAYAAAQLAAKLDPQSEEARRVLAEVREKIAAGTPTEPEAAHLAAEILHTTGMTLAQARATTWVGRGPRRAIGEILDRGAIDLRDLAWAWVQAAVIWAGEPEELTLDDPAIPVWTLETLGNGVQQFGGRPLVAEEVQQVNEVLDRLAEGRKARLRKS